MAENHQIRAVAVTVSDSRKAADDESGRILLELIESIGGSVVGSMILTDDFEMLRDKLFELTERTDVNLIVTTGGTGFAERDNTPEATRAVIEKEAPGLAETMRRETAAINPKAILSRSVCGIRNGTLIVNLPGSPKGVAECFIAIKDVLPHAIRLLSGDTKH